MVNWLQSGRLFLIFAFFSILGTLTREGVTLLSQYPGTYLSGIVWSNFTSCFIMGFLTYSSKFWNLVIYNIEILQPEVEGKEIEEQYKHFKNKKEIMLFVGLTTGYCGSFSSFSTLVLELFLDTANIKQGSLFSNNFSNPAYGLLQFLSVLITQLSMSYAGFKYGKKLILYLESTHIPDFSFSLRLLKAYGILEIVIQLLGLSFMIICLVLSIVEKTWRSWTLSFLFSPFACYLRYYLSSKFNKAPSSSPAVRLQRIDYKGTLLANVSASALLSIVTILTRGKKSSVGNERLISKVINCQVLTAVGNGFCGVLSTVSTFIVEVNSLNFARSSYYVFVSLFISFCLQLLIIGSYNWTLGLVSTPIC